MKGSILQALAKGNAARLSKDKAIIGYRCNANLLNTYPISASKMNNKKKPLNIALGVLIAVAAAILLGGQFMSTISEDKNISNATKLSEPMPNGSAKSIDLKEDTLLSIQGIKSSGCNNVVQLNDEKLLALPQQQFMTHHSWSDKAESFSGPLLQDVLDTTCSNAREIKLTALNDYAIDMDFSKLKQYQPIVALSVNGKRLSIREKGPLWIMLPLDDHKAIDERSLDSMMIWQLSDIKILKTDDNT